MELGAVYKTFKGKVKVDRVTAVLAENVVKQRTSFEFRNLLWPFGVASTTETNQKSYTEVEVCASRARALHEHLRGQVLLKCFKSCSVIGP